MVKKQDVFRMLEQLEIRHNDKIVVHSSLRAIGPIENGAEGLIEAFCEYLSDGMLLIPTHTWAGIIERRTYDPRKTVPCIGTLPTVAAFHPKGIRSLHPTHSLAVFGKDAAEYVSREKTYSTPGAADNCLSRLLEEKGRILLIGVGFECNTYIHCVEERLDIPNRIDTQEIPVTVTGYDDCTFVVPFHGHAVKGLDVGISTYYPNLEKPLAYLGAVTYATLGRAKVTCCDAVKTYEAIGMLWSKADYDLCFGEREVPEAYYK